MARYPRRLIFWLGGGLLALALLAVLAVLALVWLVDPNIFRARIATAASESLGREVTLKGDLHWRIRWTIGLESADGSISNAPGFGATPFAQWRTLRFGLDTRALLGKRILIDQLELQGLKVNLQRDAMGAGNWVFTPRKAVDPEKPVDLRIASLRLRDSELSYTDGAGALWQLGQLSLDVKLPADLNASQRELRDVETQGRLVGGSLPAAGVPVTFEANSVRHDATASTLDIPEFSVKVDDAELSGDVHAVLGDSVAAQGKVALRVPSLRGLLSGFAVTVPPMADPKTLGRLQIDGAFDLKDGALTTTDLKIALDDTALSGAITAPSLSPLALRFDLTGDTIDLDRYLEPADYKGKPLELPLAQLKALNVQGVLLLKSATVAGAKAEELRIDVE